MTSEMYEILHGDAIEKLATVAEGSIHCVVTSPPYWGLRDYGAEGQLGLEPTPEEYLEKMVDVFRSVRRVLRDDGVAWVNIGDTYAIGPKQLNLIGIPHRLALALQADRWIWRSTVIWHKPSLMPEAVNGWRWEPCKIKAGTREEGWMQRSNVGSFTGLNQKGETEHVNGYQPPDWKPCPGCEKCEKTDGMTLRKGSWRPTRSHEYLFMFAKSVDYYSSGEGTRTNTGANLRDVWTIPISVSKEAHFAIFPEKLILPIIKSGTSDKGGCSQCGSSWVRVLDWDRKTEGWRPSCECRNSHGQFFKAVPSLVLDPFSGTGTSGVAARKLGRSYIGIELNPKYVEISKRRIQQAEDETSLINYMEEEAHAKDECGR